MSYCTHAQTTMKIFNNGIAMVYEYLTTSEWNAAAQTSRQWFSVASSQSASPRRRTSTMRLLKRTIDPNDSLTLPSLEDTFASSASSPSLSITWSLHHCITAAHLKCTLDTIPRLLVLLPQLQSLSIDPEPHPYVVDLSSEFMSVFNSSIYSRLLNFPSSLSSLAIIWSDAVSIDYRTYHGKGNEFPSTHTIPQSCIDWIGTASSTSSLTDLTLGRIQLTVDLTPLCSNVYLQSSLRRLRLHYREWNGCDAAVESREQYYQAEDKRIISVLTQVSRLISLTELHLCELGIWEETVRDAISASSLCFPHLRHFVGEFLFHCSNDLDNVASLMPHIEWFPFYVADRYDVTKIALFKCLKELRLWSHSVVSGNDELLSEADAVSALCQLKLPIVTIICQECCPIRSPESWRALAQHFHAVHELEFYASGDNMAAVFQVPLLCARLTRLTLKHCCYPAEAEHSIRTHHDRLTQLAHLHIENQEDCGFINIFTSPDFIPSLRTLKVVQGQLTIEYNCDVWPLTNRCTLDGKEMSPLKRKVPTSPPAPRLVGVELNPGPTSSTSIKIFNDGIAMVYEYLTTSEWNAAVRISRQWFTVASSRRGRVWTQRVHPIDWATFEIGDDILDGVATIFSSSFSPSFGSPVPHSPRVWSLRHCITSAHLKCTLDVIPRLMVLLPHLVGLQIDPEESSYVAGLHFPIYVSSGSLTFPSALSSLTIASSITLNLEYRNYHGRRPDRYPSIHTIPQSCIDWIGTASSTSSLTELNLGRVLLILDLTPICSNVHLQSSLKLLRLHYRDWVQGDFETSTDEFEVSIKRTNEVLIQVSRLSSLTKLCLMDLFTLPEETDWTSMSVMPQLREFIGEGLCFGTDELEKLAPQMPALEWLPGVQREGPCDVTKFALLKRLKEIRLWSCVVMVNGNGNATEAQVTDVLCALDLEIEKFSLWECTHVKSVTSWCSIAVRFTSLHELDLFGAANIMSAIIQVPELCARLTRLSLEYCYYPIESEYGLLTHHQRLTQLVHLHIKRLYDRQSAESISDLYDIFTSPSFIPTLRTFDVEQDPQLIIEYNCEVSPILNHCTLDGNYTTLKRMILPSQPLEPRLGDNPAPNLIFNDGIAMVYEYLTTREWNAAAQTSHQWLSVALQPSRRRQPSSSPRLFRGSAAALLVNRPSSSLTPLTCSLLHCITDMELESSLDQLSAIFLLPLSNLRRVTFDTGEEFHDTEVPELNSFPSHLESIQIFSSFTREPMNQACVDFVVYFVPQYCIDWFAFVSPPSSLTTISLSRLDYDIDLTPLCSNITLQRQLLTLILQYCEYRTNEMNSDDQASDALVQVTRLSSLTTLTILELFCEVHDHMDRIQAMPHLRRFEVWMIVYTADFEKLSKLMPLLEWYPGIPYPTCDITPYSYFPNMKELHFDMRPSINGKEQASEEEILRALCTLTLPLERITLEHWTFESAESWNVIQLRFPDLNQLDFRYLMHPLQPIFDVPSLCHRLTHLRVVTLRDLDAFLSAAASGAFPQLTSLILEEASFSDIDCESSLTLYERFNSSRFLPTLRRLMIKMKDMEIDFDPDHKPARNRCTIDGKQMPPLVRSIQQAATSSIQSPASRLVGIELNPGPPPSTAIKIFNDGITMVLEYLTTGDWNAAAQISHQWFTVAASQSRVSSRRRTSTMRLLKRKIDPNDSLTLLQQLLEGTAASSSISPPPSIRVWSLDHCITVAHLKCTLDAIPTIVILFRNLRELNIDPEDHPYLVESSDEGQSPFISGVTSGSLTFPSSLESLTIVSSINAQIDYTIHSKHFEPPSLNTIPQVCIEWIATASSTCSLTDLNLGRIYLSVDLSSLCSNAHLQSSLKKLKLHHRERRQLQEEEDILTASFLSQVSRLSSLNELYLPELFTHDETDFTRMSVMPHLHCFVGPFLCINSDKLEQLAPIMPALEWFPGSAYGRCEVTKFALFTCLKEIRLWSGISVNGDTEVTEEEATDVLCQLDAPIEKIKLNESSRIKSVTSWQSLSNRFAALHSLDLYGAQAIMDAIIQIPELCARLTQISLEFCRFPVGSEYSILTHHSRLTQLKYLNIEKMWDREAKVIYPIFVSPSFIPTLRTLRVKHDDLLIEYDTDARPKVNQCTFNGLKPPLNRTAAAAVSPT